MNQTNYEVELDYTPSKLIQIEAGETCRIPIPVDRCPISMFEQVCSNSKFEETTLKWPKIIWVIFQLFQNDDVLKIDTEMNKICSEHIASQVDLRWRIGQINREGHASVDGLTLTFNMLDIVRTSPINWGENISHNRIILASMMCDCFVI